MVGSLETDWDLPYEKLDRPVLLLTGLYDKLFRIEEDVAELKARIPDAGELIYENAGHLIPLEDPDRFTGDLIAFGEHLRG
jgi:pimeloyl-ACP methyl ester carboxylesterase